MPPVGMLSGHSASSLLQTMKDIGFLLFSAWNLGKKNNWFARTIRITPEISTNGKSPASQCQKEHCKAFSIMFSCGERKVSAAAEPERTSSPCAKTSGSLTVFWDHRNATIPPEHLGMQQAMHGEKIQEIR